MAYIHPFKGVRPTKELAEKVASKPYDVLNSAEAREETKGNPYSYLHIVKPEIDLDPSISLYDEKVYAKAKENLNSFMEKGYLVQDKRANLYIYKQIMGDHSQVGLVTCAAVEEYESDAIRKHEYTRKDKEQDRINHIKNTQANTGPVFLTYEKRDEINAIVDEIMKGQPEYDFRSEDGIQHTLWVVDNDDKIAALQGEFAKINRMYVADGHHRSASATLVCQEKRKANPNHTGKEEYNFFLSVIFPHDQMYVMDYNRVLKNMNGHSDEDFMKKIEAIFNINKLDVKDEYTPKARHNFGMYFNKTWYNLEVKPELINENDAVKSLDVSLLQENVLTPIFGIQDPRTDKNIDFVGGIRGTNELVKRVESGECKVAFSMFPTSIVELMKVADNLDIMPPKSTWFEPKLKSGLLTHLLD